MAGPPCLPSRQKVEASPTGMAATWTAKTAEESAAASYGTAAVLLLDCCRIFSESPLPLFKIML
jgi:hypothetical protein